MASNSLFFVLSWSLTHVCYLENRKTHVKSVLSTNYTLHFSPQFLCEHFSPSDKYSASHTRRTWLLVSTVPYSWVPWLKMQCVDSSLFLGALTKNAMCWEKFCATRKQNFVTTIQCFSNCYIETDRRTDEERLRSIWLRMRHKMVTCKRIKMHHI